MPSIDALIGALELFVCIAGLGTIVTSVLGDREGRNS